jgi:glyoxylase-like metal-dependent hydrolase (beta-lactamase superfamily II)
MEIYNIETGNFKCDGGAMFSVVPKLLWSRKYPSDEDNLCNCAMRSMLVVDGERKILIDNGTGDKQDAAFFKHQHLNGDATLLSSLSNIGFQPTDITDVIFTHLHFDHCGGAVKHNSNRDGFDLVFPNATHWVSKMQWENFVNPNIREADAYFQENIVPIKDAGRLRFVEKEGELFPNFEIRFVNGHTPGLMVSIIKNENHTIVFAGDFIPTAANVPVKWLASYDLSPTESLREKEVFLKEAVENHYILFFQHDIINECCSLVQTPRGVKVDKCFSLSKIK